MKGRAISYAVVAVAFVAVLSLLLVSMPAAQESGAASNKPVPRLANGKPDFSGFYNRDHFSGDPIEERPGEHIINRLEGGTVFFDYAGANQAQLHVAPQSELDNPPPYKPEYQAKVKEIQKTTYGGTTALDPYNDCKPLGIPRAATSIMQVVHTPAVMAVLYEAAPGPAFRVIYTDGRKHPENLDTSFFGHSVGHWEGDVLVVDTVGLNDETWLGGGQGTSNNATIHSDQLHVVERWTRSGDTLNYTATVEDPVMFTKPWIINPRRASIAPEGDYMQTQMCSHTSVNGLNRKDHMVQETDKDKFLCGWCNTGSVYGTEADKLTTGQAIPDQLKDGLKSKAK
jgi:hypothetical protein